jgi:hypothetical protein|tara:strand:+ start:513 stop:701 length:189 start_codon:yes stop_codon:yes gene_type:complete
MKIDYNKMRCALACFEAESIDRESMYEILLFGTTGWKDNTNEEVKDSFINLWGEEQIPYLAS